LPLRPRCLRGCWPRRPRAQQGQQSSEPWGNLLERVRRAVAEAGWASMTCRMALGPASDPPCSSAFAPGAFKPIEQCTARWWVGGAPAATSLRRAPTPVLAVTAPAVPAHASLGIDAGVLAAGVRARATR